MSQSPRESSASKAPQRGLSALWTWLTKKRGSTAAPAAAPVAATQPSPNPSPKPKAEGRAGKSKRKAAPVPELSPQEAKARQSWKDALVALGHVLDRHPSSRQVFRHLAAMEAAVAKHGPKAPGRLQMQVLELGLDQFEGLVRDWSVPSLAFLRSQMAMEMNSRRKVQSAKEQELSVFVSPNKLHVLEDSESAFAEFQRHWAAANGEASGRPRRAA